MSGPLLALVMIVKDEAPNIRATLASVRGHVDAWVVLDTGSTDGTQAIVREAMARVPGDLVELPFTPFEPLLPERRIIDFAATRNEVLDAQSRITRAEFAFMLSGDERLVGGEALRAHLEAHRDAEDGAYCVSMRSGSSSWHYPRVLRASAGWRYVGAVHEVPVGPKGEVGGPVVPGVEIRHEVTDKARRFRRMRYGDFPVLSHIVDDPATPVADRARAISYLAQTHESLADECPREPGSAWLSHKMAAMACYRRRVELGGDRDEVNYSGFHYLNVAETVGFYNDWEILDRLQALVKEDPRRPEVRYMIATHAAACDARKGLVLALEAVKVARQAREKPLHLPTDDRIEWMAYRVAAACAVELGRAEKYVRELVEAGIAAGGPLGAFAGFQKK